MNTCSRSLRFILAAAAVILVLSCQPGPAGGQTPGDEGDPVDDTVAAPVITPVAGQYSNWVTLKIDCSTPNTGIMYTIDGTEPDFHAIGYSDSDTIELYQDTTVKAMAYRIGTPEVSEVTTVDYTFSYITPNAEPIEEGDLNLSDNFQGPFTVSNGSETWFELTLSAENIEVQLQFSHSEGDINAEIVDIFGTVLASSTSETDDEILNVIYDKTSKLYVRVYSDASSGQYFRIRWDDV